MEREGTGGGAGEPQAVMVIAIQVQTGSAGWMLMVEFCHPSVCLVFYAGKLPRSGANWKAAGGLLPTRLVMSLLGCLTWR